ncbi:MAG: flavin reductase family protein [Thermoplasmata archaeon]
MDVPTPVNPIVFRRAMGRWATGVSVVTTRGMERDFGLTVNSFASVSLRPPSVLVSIGDESDSAPVIRASGTFGVSVLRDDQAEVSTRMARVGQGEAKFEGVRFHRSPSGIAWLDGALFSIECRVTGELRASDHTLFLGEVLSIQEGGDGLPLLFYHSDYARSAGPETVRLPPPRR